MRGRDRSADGRVGASLPSEGGFAALGWPRVAAAAAAAADERKLPAEIQPAA